MLAQILLVLVLVLATRFSALPAARVGAVMLWIECMLVAIVDSRRDLSGNWMSSVLIAGLVSFLLAVISGFVSYAVGSVAESYQLSVDQS